MMKFLVVFCAACVIVLLGSLLAISWWWIKYEIRYRVLLRVAASYGRMADRIEEALEHFRTLTEESNRLTEEIRIACKRS